MKFRDDHILVPIYQKRIGAALPLETFFIIFHMQPMTCCYLVVVQENLQARLKVWSVGLYM